MKNKIRVSKIIKKCKLTGNFSQTPIRIVSGIFALLLATTSLTACNSNNYFDLGTSDSYVSGYDDNYYWDYESDLEYDDGYYENSEDNSENYEGDVYIEDANYVGSSDLNKFLNINVSLNPSSLVSYQNFVSKIKVEYKYSKYYNISKVVSKYKASKGSSNTTSSKIIKNNQVNFDELYSIVKKNNDEYRRKNSGETYYAELDDSVLRQVVKYIIETINYNLKNNKNISVNVLDYKLSNLKVFSYSDFGYAFYSQDDIAIAVNMSNMPSESNEKISVFQELISHETNHLLQDAFINKDDNVEQSYGFCYQFEDEEVNGLYWNWFVEACAQNSVVVQSGMKPSSSFIYDSNIFALNSLNSTSALLGDDKINLGDLMVQSDLDELFKYFGAKTEEEKNEIIKLMIAYNIVLDPSDYIFSSKFFDSAPEIEQYVYEKQLKNSIGQTQTKIFYRNLAEKLKNKTVKIGDVFSLISIFETELNRNIWYASSENSGYLDEFYENYSEIQKEFFELIANSLNLTVDDVCLYYNSYHNTMDQSNLDNDLLSSKQNNFYKKLYNSTKTSKGKTVIEIDDYIKKFGHLNY